VLLLLRLAVQDLHRNRQHRELLLKASPRRFPPPWTVEDIGAAFVTGTAARPLAVKDVSSGECSRYESCRC
jgi:hypothetical protein